MNLYSIIYEAARTAEEALSKGVSAVVTRGPKDTYFNHISLFDNNRLMKAIEPRTSKPTESDDVINLLGGGSYDSATDAAQRAANRALVGTIVYVKNQRFDDLFQISSSGAVSSFGPLAYQIVMYVISPAWLASDTSLKPASQRVWEKMFELSEQGVYERKFLGLYSANEIYERLPKNLPRNTFYGYMDLLELEKIPPTEEAFLEWLKKNTTIEPKTVGNFWCYSKTSHDPKIVDMFANGEKVIKELEAKYNMPEKDVKNLLKTASAKLFDRLYGSKASD
jgi:hypothetical protein